MRIAAILAAFLAAAVVSCGSGSGPGPAPGGTVSLTGVYQGTATAPGGASIVVEIEFLQHPSFLEAALRYPDDTGVAPLFGSGSSWGRSFALVMNKRTGREFYLEGWLSEDLREMNATIRYPDRGETLTVWALRT
jgi:hypothetical protein